jgi:hypothetical protein
MGFDYHSQGGNMFIPRENMSNINIALLMEKYNITPEQINNKILSLKEFRKKYAILCGP